MSNIQKRVYRVWSDTLRHGEIVEEKLERGWKYFRIRWMADSKYERLQNNNEKDNRWYRRDHVVIYDPAKLCFIGGMK